MGILGKLFLFSKGVDNIAGGSGELIIGAGF
jgi:hypothetical protein